MGALAGRRSTASRLDAGQGHRLEDHCASAGLSPHHCMAWMAEGIGRGGIEAQRKRSCRSSMSRRTRTAWNRVRACHLCTVKRMRNGFPWSVRFATFSGNFATIAAKVASKDRHAPKATGDCGLRRLRVRICRRPEEFDGSFLAKNPCGRRQPGISIASDRETRLPGLPVTTPVTT